MYSIEEFDKTKTKILKYIMYKKRTENEIRTKFNTIEEELLEDSIEYLKEAGYINDKNYIEVPTTLSAKEALSKGFQSLPFRQSMEKLNILLDELNKQMPVLLPQVTKTFKDVDKVVTSNTRATADAFDNFNKAMVSVNEAAKSIRNLTDYLERHPEALLKGKRGN